MQELDITDLMTNGNIDEIIFYLTHYRSFGFNKLDWDGWDSTIKLYRDKDMDSLEDWGIPITP